MASFLYLIRGGSSVKMSKAAAKEHYDAWASWMQELGQNGHLRGGEPLKVTGRTLKGKDRQVTSEPVGKGRNVVDGYMLIEAKSVAEAGKIAKGCPCLDIGGSVEIRPCAKM